MRVNIFDYFLSCSVLLYFLVENQAATIEERTPYFDDDFSDITILQSNNQKFTIYRNAIKRECYVETVPTSKTNSDQPYSRTLFLGNLKINSTDPIYKELGQDVLDFCKNYPMFTLEERSSSASPRRGKRQVTQAKKPYFKGQTQTQFISFDNEGKNDKGGTAEATAEQDKSTATVQGRMGMGQAQSQSGSGDPCEECAGSARTAGNFGSTYPSSSYPTSSGSGRQGVDGSSQQGGNVPGQYGGSYPSSTGAFGGGQNQGGISQYPSRSEYPSGGQNQGGISQYPSGPRYPSGGLPGYSGTPQGSISPTGVPSFVDGQNQPVSSSSDGRLGGSGTQGSLGVSSPGSQGLISNYPQSGYPSAQNVAGGYFPTQQLGPSQAGPAGSGGVQGGANTYPQGYGQGGINAGAGQPTYGPQGGGFSSGGQSSYGPHTGLAGGSGSSGTGGPQYTPSQGYNPATGGNQGAGGSLYPPGYKPQLETGLGGSQGGGLSYPQPPGHMPGFGSIPGGVYYPQPQGYIPQSGESGSQRGTPSYPQYSGSGGQGAGISNANSGRDASQGNAIYPQGQIPQGGITGSTYQPQVESGIGQPGVNQYQPTGTTYPQPSSYFPQGTGGASALPYIPQQTYGPQSSSYPQQLGYSPQGAVPSYSQSIGHGLQGGSSQLGGQSGAYPQSGVTTVPGGGGTYPQSGVATVPGGGGTYPQSGVATVPGGGGTYPQSGVATVPGGGIYPQPGVTTVPGGGGFYPQSGATTVPGGGGGGGSYPQSGVSTTPGQGGGTYPQGVGGGTYPQSGVTAVPGGGGIYPQPGVTTVPGGGGFYPQSGATTIPGGGGSYPQSPQPGVTTVPGGGSFYPQSGATIIPGGGGGGGGSYPQSGVSTTPGGGGGMYPQGVGGGTYPQSGATAVPGGGAAGGTYPQGVGGGTYPQSGATTVPGVGGGTYPQSGVTTIPGGIYTQPGSPQNTGGIFYPQTSGSEYPPGTSFTPQGTPTGQANANYPGYYPYIPGTGAGIPGGQDLPGSITNTNQIQGGGKGVDISYGSQITPVDTASGESQSLSSLNLNPNGTNAAASAQGKTRNGLAQAQVSGTYTGSFSAQAQTSDNEKSVQTQIFGNTTSASSSSQGKAGKSESQSQILYNYNTGSTLAESQGSGINYSTNTQIQAGNRGGIADAQSTGSGSTSSQAQIGFLPLDPKRKDQTALFEGGGTSSSQNNALSGQSQTQLQGSFKSGPSFTGSAQSSSGKAQNKTKLAFDSSDLSYPINDATKTPSPLGEISGKHVKKENGIVKSTVPLSSLPQSDQKDFTKNTALNSAAPQYQDAVIKSQKYDAYIDRDSSDMRTSFNAGDLVPGTDNYRIPNGFRGKVASTAGDTTHATATSLGHAQSQTVLLKPGKGRVTINNLNRPDQPNFQNDANLLGDKKNTFDEYVTVTKSEAGELSGDKKYAHTYYTKSSTCGYFTFTCNYIDGSNGRTKICKPGPLTYSDGTPCS